MQLKSYEAGYAWLPIPRSDLVTNPCKRFSATYRLPEDSGKKTALARLLTYTLPDTAITLIIQEHDIWTSGENEFLFTAFRDLAAGCPPRTVDEAPFLLFAPTEKNLFECFWAIATYFYWDAVAFTENGSLILNTSHDEYFSVQTDDDALFQQLTTVLETTKFDLLYKA